MHLDRSKLDYTVFEFIGVNMFLGDTATSHGDSGLVNTARVAAQQWVPVE